MNMYSAENYDLNSVALLLKFRRKNRRDEVIMNFDKKLALPRLAWNYFTGLKFKSKNEVA